MRIVFMGTPQFAIPCLDMLVREGYDVQAVVTQPDKPKGRGKKLAPPTVKEYALKAQIKVLQPDNVNTGEFISELKKMNPALIVTVAYGKILCKDILDIPPLGCINVHASLLPRYRGAAPIQWAIINGEKVTGVTTMFMDAGMDTGDMLLKKEVEITEDMTAGELHDRLSIIGAEVLKETLERLQKGMLKRVPQSNEEATYAPIIKKELGTINWHKPSIDIHNLVRGTNPWPGAFTYYKGQRMRVWKTKLISTGPDISGEMEKRFPAAGLPGTILKCERDGITVATADGSIKILEIQLDSGRRMNVEECWHNLHEGEIFG